eukprot:TRINITY_DN1506_c0_g2_i1.p1 TRINITY_DN1506_c0_g2~~TRINITY_DN1506_c0_g2_i1.p1  ORF type:complete len:363 (+),score=120.10 TRINITY_DN1506_c0_g2_i1:448-1536(+)
MPSLSPATSLAPPTSLYRFTLSLQLLIKLLLNESTPTNVSVSVAQLITSLQSWPQVSHSVMESLPDLRVLVISTIASHFASMCPATAVSVSLAPVSAPVSVAAPLPASSASLSHKYLAALQAMLTLTLLLARADQGQGQGQGQALLVDTAYQRYVATLQLLATAAPTPSLALPMASQLRIAAMQAVTFSINHLNTVSRSQPAGVWSAWLCQLASALTPLVLGGVRQALLPADGIEAIKSLMVLVGWMCPPTSVGVPPLLLVVVAVLVERLQIDDASWQGLQDTCLTNITNLATSHAEKFRDIVSTKLSPTQRQQLENAIMAKRKAATASASVTGSGAKTTQSSKLAAEKKTKKVKKSTAAKH